MVVKVSETPNPRAMKFSVGAPVGGPTTFTLDTASGDPLASAVLSVDGVTSMFLSADFITVTKEQAGDWSVIVPAVIAILEGVY
jgi:hypothetical protein